MTTAARYIGARVRRVEDARLLRGRGTFVDDITRPGMLHAGFVRSPFARARSRSIDTTAARAVPGVRAVFTAADLNPGVHAEWRSCAGGKFDTTLAESASLDDPGFDDALCGRFGSGVATVGL